jgi:hypothetical protein
MGREVSTFNMFAKEIKEEVYDLKDVQLGLLKLMISFSHVKVVVHTAHFVSLVFLFERIGSPCTNVFLFWG